MLVTDDSSAPVFGAMTAFAGGLHVILADFRNAIDHIQQPVAAFTDTQAKDIGRQMVAGARGWGQSVARTKSQGAALMALQLGATRAAFLAAGVSLIGFAAPASAQYPQWQAVAATCERQTENLMAALRVYRNVPANQKSAELSHIAEYFGAGTAQAVVDTYRQMKDPNAKHYDDVTVFSMDKTSECMARYGYDLRGQPLHPWKPQ